MQMAWGRMELACWSTGEACVAVAEGKRAEQALWAAGRTWALVLCKRAVE